MVYNLQQLVLAECKVPILVQLQLLSEPLHWAAVHAALPSIAVTSSISANSRWQHSSYADPFWRVLRGARGLTRLDTIWHRLGHDPRSEKGDISHLEQFLPPDLTAELAKCISKLGELKSLSILDMSIHSVDLHCVLESLQCPLMLTRLDLSDKIEGQCRQATELFKILNTSVSHLCSLNISRNDLDRKSTNALGRCIVHLSALSTLNINECRMH